MIKSKIRSGREKSYYHYKTDKYYTLKEMVSNEMPGLPHCTCTIAGLDRRIKQSIDDPKGDSLDKCISKPVGKQWQTARKKNAEVRARTGPPVPTFGDDPMIDVYKLMRGGHT